MDPRPEANRKAASFPVLLLIAGIWALFCTGIVWLKNGDAFGDDLAEIYRAARLYHEGHARDIYLPGPAETQDAVRPTRPLNIGFTQPPLVAAVLAPIAGAIPFRFFDPAALALNIFAYAVALLMALRAWKPHWAGTGPYLVLLVLAMLSTPFQSAIWLNQIQMSVVLLITVALIAAERGSRLSAGICAAFAIFLKVSPGAVLLAWLCSGSVAAVAAAIAAEAVLVLVSIAICGVGLNSAFVERLVQLSREIVVALNNQSLASFCYGKLHEASFLWRVYALPADVRAINGCAITAFAVGLGMLAIRLDGKIRYRATAILAIAATLVVTPIAWDHYSIIMPILLLLLPNAWFARPRRVGEFPAEAAWFAIVGAIILLELFPISPMLIWSKLYAAILLSVAIVILGRRAPPDAIA